jgi:hypothetical protein
MHEVRTIKNSASLHLHINNKGVMPGKAKLALFQKAIALRTPPRLGSQVAEERDNMMACVRIFDPYGGRNWYILEWDRKNSAWAYQLLDGQAEFAHVDLETLAHDPGALSAGLEVDIQFKPTKVGQLKV